MPDPYEHWVTFHRLTVNKRKLEPVGFHGVAG